MTSATPTSAALSAARLASVTTVRSALVGLVAATFVLRAVLSLQRSIPRYFPDEFLYAGIARSLGKGDGVTVLGQPASLPALLEPILLTPVWRVADAGLAMALTQTLHSLWIALAAVPVFALARMLGLPDRWALFCGAVAALAPAGYYASLVTADALGYLLALVAVASGVRLISVPSRRSELLCLACLGLATFARLQYAVVAVAVAAAVLVVERGRPTGIVRRFPLLVAGAGLAAVAAVAAVGLGGLGRYSTLTSFRLSSESGTWFLAGLFLIVAATGVVLVPGGLAWLVAALRSRTDRAQTSFAVITVITVISLLGMASVYTVESGSARFLERYVILAAPLFALCLACWFNAGRPHGRVAAAAGGAVVVAAAAVPVSQYAVALGVSDSPTLFTVFLGEIHLGIGNASLLAALILTSGALLAVAAGLRAPLPASAVAGFGLVVLAALSVGSHIADRQTGAVEIAKHFSGDPAWIDRQQVGPTMLVLTDRADRLDAMLTAVTNSDVTSAALIGTLEESRGIDGLGSPVTVAANGELRRAGSTIRQPVALSTASTAVGFSNAARVVYDSRFALAVPKDEARLSFLAEGVRSNGKLLPNGRIRVFPTPDGRCTRFSAQLSVPRGVPPTTIAFAHQGHTGQILVVSAGAPRRISVESSAIAGVALKYRTLLLGRRKPSPFDGAVADVRFTAQTVPCAAPQ